MLLCLVVLYAMTVTARAATTCHRSPLRSVWVWHYRQVLAAPRRVLDQLRRRGITRVYLQVAPPLKVFKPFLALAHRAHIEVFALDGNPGDELVQRPLLRIVARIIQFNRHRVDGFDGLQLDVEPYANSAFWTDPDRYLGPYLTLLASVHREIGRLPLSIAIPVWFARMRWRQTLLSAAVLGVADEVVVMSYHGSIREAQKEATPVFRQAFVLGKPAYLGMLPHQGAAGGWGAGACPGLQYPAGFVLESYQALRTYRWTTGPAAPR